jgi:asparagine synthase (glutamine-hydrolysing)
MPIYPKRRFQHGAATPTTAARWFTEDEARYRRHFHTLHA